MKKFLRQVHFYPPWRNLRKERAAAEAQLAIVENCPIGSTAPGRGTDIYMGPQNLSFMVGPDIKMMLYTSPYDFRENPGEQQSFTFEAAAESLTAAKNFCGHKGRRFNNNWFVVQNPQDYYNGLMRSFVSRTYKGEWFVPTVKCLEVLFKHKNDGDLKGTLITEASQDTAKYLACDPAQKWVGEEDIRNRYGVERTVIVDFAKEGKVICIDPSRRHRTFSLRPFRAEYFPG